VSDAFTNDAKFYEVEGRSFEFTPNGSPLAGGMAVVEEALGTFTATVDLSKIGSRKTYANEAAEMYGFDANALKRALNEICTLRTTEIRKAQEKDANEEEAAGEENEPLSEEAEALVSSSGVLDRYVEDVARIRGVIKDRDALGLQTLVAFGAQLALLPSGRPAGANLVLTAEAGRGKNYICDAVAAALPEEFYLAFESASAKSLFYRAENDPGVFRHKWFYPNEAEGTDLLVETLRPILSGGRASHLTVNKSAEGRNSAQELNIEGPVSLTIPTVRNKLDGQLQTRMLVAELEDYDGRVAGHSRAVSRQLLPDHAGEDHGPKVKAWRAALRSLASCRRVVFPLDNEEFCFDSDTISHGARLWANLLGLMLAHAWMEQRSREIVELASGERAIVAAPGDYEAAYNVFKATCERSVVNLSDTHRAILDAVYDLSSQSAFDGFSLRKIADAAGVHHSTVAEHKTYLTKSVKLLYEVEDGGLDLVSGAEPSWWQKDDLLVGFPRPEQVRRWWDGTREDSRPKPQGVPDSAPEIARQARQPENEAGNPDTYGGNAVGHPTRHPPDATRQPEPERRSAEVPGTKTAVSDEAPDSEKPIHNANADAKDRVSGVSGGFGNEEADTKPDLCIHDYPGGVGCYTCDPNHPYRRKNHRRKPGVREVLEERLEANPRLINDTPENIAAELFIHTDLEPTAEEVKEALKRMKV
jgi:hypothetical protein